MREYVLIGGIIIFLYLILKENNIIGSNKSVKKAKADVKLEKTRRKKEQRIRKGLQLSEWFANNFGVTPSSIQVEQMQYIIDRKGKQIESVDRTFKAVEWLGILKLIMLIGVISGSALFIVTSNPIALVLLVTLFSKQVYTWYMMAEIKDEDEQIEKSFPDFYLVVYSRLVQGVRTRIAPTLADYMKSLESVKDKQKNEAIRKFVSDLQLNIEIYHDESIAIMKLRDKYKSVMVINFCNLAVQSFRGVDNKDKLLSFKMELNEKRSKMMSKRAQMLVKRGEIAVWAIYIILFEILGISILAKFSQTGGLGSIF